MWNAHGRRPTKHTKKVDGTEFWNVHSSPLIEYVSGALYFPISLCPERLVIPEEYCAQVRKSEFIEILLQMMFANNHVSPTSRAP